MAPRRLSLTLDQNHLRNLKSADCISYAALTGDIEVLVVPELLPQQSRRDQSMYAWAYHVTIVNRGDRAVQLLRRHWLIKDGNGRLDQVEGEGVIGVQPVLQPGASFSYSSGCPLQTPTGNMRGWYHYVEVDSRIRRKCRIPLFFLRIPSSLH